MPLGLPQLQLSQHRECFQLDFPLLPITPPTRYSYIKLTHPDPRTYGAKHIRLLYLNELDCWIGHHIAQVQSTYTRGGCMNISRGTCISSPCVIYNKITTPHPQANGEASRTSGSKHTRTKQLSCNNLVTRTVPTTS